MDIDEDITIIEDRFAIESISRKYLNILKNTEETNQEPMEPKNKFTISDSEDEETTVESKEVDYFDQLASSSSLFNKYVPKTIQKEFPIKNELPVKNNCIEILSSSDSEPESQRFDFNLKENSPLINYSDDEQVPQEIQERSPAKKAKSQKQRKENQIEKQKKKEELARNKQIKKVLSAANKNIKPDECVKHITAIIDNNLMSNPLGTEICSSLKNLGCNYTIDKQLVSNTVTWTTKSLNHFVDDDVNIKELTEITEEKDLLLILNASEVLDYVAKQKLLEKIESIKSIFGDKRISLGILEMNAYFKEKRKQKTSKRNNSSSEIINVSRKDLEVALCELQLFSNCSYRFLDSNEDLAAIITQFTKSIAQRPYKLQKYQREKQTEHFLSGDNKDCVKVDKNGNGLKRLWQQHLTSFPLVRLETAESVIEKFPTLSSLIKAYNQCQTDQEKDFLLSDIQIRRNAGPLAGNRRIGPEISKKLSKFYNSLNGETTL